MMKREIRDKQKQYYLESIYLNSINTDKTSYEKQREIKEIQTEAYNKYHFYKNLNIAMSKVGKI